ncbi:MAG: hypothetical protein DMG71_11265, partial [Acidobacteria bacterium]
LEAARSSSWAETIRNRVPRPELSKSILDLQRASWLSLLNLDPEAVGLDIGSGYGAITHALACSLGRVISVEAVPERIEFTQERLRQERINNVELLQASATALPIAEDSCDLAVVNGVLEWVGEWDLEGDARTAQLRFLSRVYRLLKSNGVLLVGIENRFGYGSFLGARDHSGLRYTNLVPRRCATWLLRRNTSPHYRTTLNLRREYRTLTYSARGLRKLLSEAGFQSVVFYWADPGYNEPYSLVPLDSPQLVKERLLETLNHPGALKGNKWRKNVKRTLAKLGIFPWFIPDFVVLARKGYQQESIDDELYRRELESRGQNDKGPAREQKLALCVYTHPFHSKVTVTARDHVSGRHLLVAKVHLPAPRPASNTEREFVNLSLVSEHLNTRPDLLISVPRPIRSFRRGKTLYNLEAAAHGTQFSRLVREPRYFDDLGRVERDFGRVVEASLQVTAALESLAALSSIDPTCYELPSDETSPPELCRRVEELRYFRGSSDNSRVSFVQHGDFSVENVFLDRETGRIEIIDWTDAGRGFPPLYDIFLLFCSSAYLQNSHNRRRVLTHDEFWMASFEDLFLSERKMALVVRRLLLAACDRLKIPPEQLRALLVEFLIIRMNFCRLHSNPTLQRICRQQLDLLLEPRGERLLRPPAS